MVVPKDTTNNMWIFLKLLKADLWLSTAGLFVMAGYVIWLIERPINNDFQGPISQQIGMVQNLVHIQELDMINMTTVIAEERLLSNFSRFIVIVWVFVVLILMSSYTATMTSMITVQHIQLNSKENYIGYQKDSFTKGVINYLNFKTLIFSHLLILKSMLMLYQEEAKKAVSQLSLMKFHNSKSSLQSIQLIILWFFVKVLHWGEICQEPLQN